MKYTYTEYKRKHTPNKCKIICIYADTVYKMKYKAYKNKINVINVITAPEIEMLIIHAEGQYKQFKHSKKKPSEFCKVNLRMHDVKSYDFVKNYFNDAKKLVAAIKEHQRTAKLIKGTYGLNDLLKDN